MSQTTLLGIKIFKLIASNVERARTRELLSTVIWDFQTTYYLGNYWFFRYEIWKKKCLFTIIKSKPVINRPGRVRSGPAVMVFEGLFLSKFKRCKCGNLTQFLHGFLSFFGQILKQKSMLVLYLYRFWWSMMFIIFYAILRITHELLNISDSDYLKWKNVKKRMRITKGLNWKKSSKATKITFLAKLT